MKQVLFASRNRGKIREAQAILDSCEVTLLSMDDFPLAPDVEEDGTTFYENALKKASEISRHTGVATIADDSGLEVDALGGRPGVHSARFAGPRATDSDNIRCLLKELGGVAPEKRQAAFRCVLVYYRPDGFYRAFEGSLEGTIAMEPSGDGGFGYDPVFLLPGGTITVAQLDGASKNRISHRGKAFEKLRHFLLS
ncbi:MAG: XTP/dITP diphosphatase [Syntrophales bacterium]|nr:XTP/dITP diphosphatase [Syntrophales bacterium]MCK9527203.1 XTP/dITP diphosphatase [Syntrophales bacterium]MDX9921327.1 XTP/dITP diphosphatase [Syntrophales bacterium]